MITPLDRDCDEVSRLMTPPTSQEDVHRKLRKAGYDPDAVKAHFGAIAARAIAKAKGLAYRVNCYRQGPRMVCDVSEWHATLASAREAFADHQQRPWSSVALVPQCVQVPYQEQLRLALDGREEG